MGLSARLVVGGVAAGAALAFYVHKRHAQSGESYMDIISQLPALARGSVTDMKRRATLAIEDGKAAARAREDEFVRELAAAESPSSSGFPPQSSW